MNLLFSIWISQSTSSVGSQVIRLNLAAAHHHSEMEGDSFTDSRNRWLKNSSTVKVTSKFKGSPDTADRLTFSRPKWGWHLNISVMPSDFLPLPHPFVLYAPWTGGSFLSIGLGQTWPCLD